VAVLKRERPRPRLDRHPQRKLLHYRGWVDCTIGTNGAKLPKIAPVSVM
jgi:hypothetical protein